MDGKTLRVSKMSSDGTGALRLVLAYATEAGLVLADASFSEPASTQESEPPLAC